MSRRALTFRADDEMVTALNSLGKVLGRPVNHLITEAVNEYLKRPHRGEREIEDQLARLRAYREADPGYEKAIQAFAEAEVALPDPVEGNVVEDGPFRKEIRSLLNG